MDRRRQPATRVGSDSEWDPDELDRVGLMRRGWAMTRWAVLVMAVGIGAAVLVSILVTVLLTLLNATI
jgi:hypothetical protein